MTPGPTAYVISEKKMNCEHRGGGFPPGGDGGAGLGWRAMSLELYERTGGEGLGGSTRNLTKQHVKIPRPFLPQARFQ